MFFETPCIYTFELCKSRWPGMTLNRQNEYTIMSVMKSNSLEQQRLAHVKLNNVILFIFWFFSLIFSFCLRTADYIDTKPIKYI